ncbi:MAG TPA: S8 family peptidase, partial [Bacteroidia bacterium]|nr:S8 family peptidase [Bacteroidia bacterium]
DTIPQGARADYVLANPSIIDGFDYIFKYADSVGKPAVINLSWGMHTGPHDGTSLFDQALDALVGTGKIIVGSAGNERGRWMHFDHNFSGDTVSTWAGENIRRDETFESIYVDFWGSPSTEFSLQMVMVDSSSAILGQSGWVSSTQEGTHAFEIVSGNDTVTVTFECDSASVLNDKPNILVQANNNHPLNSYMVLRATSLNTSLNGWNSGGVDRYTSGGFNNLIKGSQPFSNMKAGNDNTSVGENGGTAERVITVGAYATSFTWLNAFGGTLSTFAYPGYLANFSSMGPTVDGRIKPDVVSPGITVSSAFNRYAIDPFSLSYISTVNGTTDFYGVLSGTSMAAPQVTGIVALMLEQNPALTPETVRSILQQTAAKDTFTKTTPNNLYGWGKVDALAALQAVKGNTGLKGVLQSAGIQVFPNPSSDVVKIAILNGDNQIIRCDILTIEGRKVKEQSVNGNETVIQVKDLATGVYLLQIETAEGAHILRFVKQ